MESIAFCTEDYCTRAVQGLPTMPVLCAWCLREQALPFGNGSHGICEAHAAIENAQCQARRAARQRRMEEG